MKVHLDLTWCHGTVYSCLGYNCVSAYCFYTNWTPIINKIINNNNTNKYTPIQQHALMFTCIYFYENILIYNWLASHWRIGISANNLNIYLNITRRQWNKLTQDYDVRLCKECTNHVDHFYDDFESWYLCYMEINCGKDRPGHLKYNKKLV